MNIKDFLGSDDWRPIYKAPFNFEGRTIATNGHALLSVPIQEGIKDLEGPISGGVKQVLNNLESAVFSPLPDDIELPTTTECPECKGMKKAVVEMCDECDGEGEVDAETDYNTYPGLECKSCKGEGRSIKPGGEDDCSRCLGAGEIYPPHAPIAIGGMHVNACLLKKIIDAKDLVISPLPKDNMLLFKAGDYEGVLMGMKV